MTIRSPFSMRIVGKLSGIAYTLAFVACMNEPDSKHPQMDANAKPESSQLQNPPHRELPETDKANIGVVNGKEVYTDPISHESFLLNPNRIVLGAKKNGLAKIASTIGTWTDATGSVEVTFYMANAPSSYDSKTGCNVANVSVEVDADRVVVGGGAEAANAGSFITKSYPLSSTVWAAQSKDHGPLVPHNLFVYAIGLRLKYPNGDWMSATDLKTFIDLQAITKTGGSFSTIVQNNNAYTTIGGGVNIQWTTKGQLLTENRPGEGIPGWVVASKSHKSFESCPVTAYAIGIRNSHIDYFGTLKFLVNGQYKFIKSMGTSGSGLVYDKLTSVDGYVTTSMGTRSVSDNGAGRLIQRMGYLYNNEGKIFAYSETKDHFVASSGTTYTYLIGLSRY